MSSSDFSEIDIEEFDDLIASPLSSPRSRGTLDLSNHHPVDMAPALTPSLPKLTTSSDEKVKEPYVRSTASERSSSAFPPDLSATYKKHERFYFDDGNITFLVEDVLYNVHRYFFCRDSSHFVNLLSTRYGDPSISLSEPLILRDAKSADFDVLLRILYPLDFYECEIATVNEWTSVLHLATQWSFSSIRKLAISRLEPIATPVDKIILGRTYHVDAWLLPGFVAICHRQQPLTRDEGRRLGVDDAVLVACLRESLHACSTKPRAEDIINTVQACLKSPDIADKGPILFTVSDTSSPTDATLVEGDTAPDALVMVEAGAEELATSDENAKGKMKEHLKLDTATGASAGPTIGTGASQLPSAVDKPPKEETGGGDDDAKEEEKEESKDNKQWCKGKKCCGKKCCKHCKLGNKH